MLAGHARSLHRRFATAGARRHRSRETEGRTRMSILSPGLGRHPVGWLTLAGLERLPEEGFDLIVCSQRGFEDPLDRRFRALAAEWRDVPAGLTDHDLAEWLRARDLDLLLEMGGHGEGGRVSCLRHRPAPVAVKWVGAQSATTGVPGVAWMLTDARETPAGFEPHYTEQLLRLPDGYVCYTPPPYARPPSRPCRP
ncbi:O-linked N-acetylglucosamine transferase family protein [Sabulicella glaciei]|uniref:O-linked N-acetylglucosamine transferase family protein n=1 Tax=Sabulicella glaciei TaxID=2984948 RepID=UPI0034A06F18